MTTPLVFRPRRLNGISAPVGTILGPNTMGELLVVRGVDEDGVTVGYATVHDIEAAKAAARDSGPRSVTEHRLMSVTAGSGPTHPGPSHPANPRPSGPPSPPTPTR